MSTATGGSKGEQLPNCYTTEYLAEFDVVDETYNDSIMRNRRARELRSKGYVVEAKKWNFQDLARCYAYSLHATKKRGDNEKK